MYLSKNKILILIILLCTILLVGCKKEMPNEIKKEDIYNQIEEEYLIYFYKARCPYCEKCEDIIKDYIVQDESPIKLYTCDLSKDKEIKRYYEGAKGQGSKGQYFVDGVTNYKDLYIAGVPTIIKIKNENGIKVGEYIASGKSKVIEYINEQKKAK